MKKILCVLLSVLFIAGMFSACSTKPTNELTKDNVELTVNTVFENLVNFNCDELDKYVSSTTLSIIIKYAKTHSQFSDLGSAMFSSLTYEIKDIDLDNKTVTLAVQNKDMFNLAYDYTSELMKTYSSFDLMQRLTDDTWLDNNLAKLTEEISKAEMQSEQAEITLTILVGRQNLMLEFTEDDENAISGGALSAIKAAL